MKKRLLFLGPPGAGKGTQASLLCNKCSLLHLSTGDLLREEVSSGTDLGRKISDIIDKGELVNDSLVLSIVEKKLTLKIQGWLLDGFPRNLNQAKALKDVLDKMSQPIESVVLIDIKDEILVKRLLGRGRKDDNENVIRHRLNVYREQTSPLIDHYSQQGLLKIIQGDADIEIVSSRINEALK